MPTILSRCQAVRFDPLPPEGIAASLQARGVAGESALACARLALGDGELALRLASPEGERLRAVAERLAGCALTGQTGERPCLKLLEAGRAAGTAAGERLAERIGEELELVPAKERKRLEREGLEARRRVERRARTETIDLGLRLSELWLRDLMVLAAGAPDLVHACDRREQLLAHRSGAGAGALEQAIELVGAARLSLALNVSEELALEAMAYRIAALEAPAAA